MNTPLAITAIPFQKTKCKIIDRNAFRLAQRTAKEAVTEYEWKCAIFKLKQAYEFEAEEPFPVIGDVRGNYTCVFSDYEACEYAFALTRLIKHREI